MPDDAKPTGIKAGQLIEKYKAIARAERKAARALAVERDQLKAQPSNEELQKQVDGFKADRKAAAYRKAFDAEAVAAGLNPKAFETAYGLAKIDETAEAPDAAAIKARVAAVLGDHDYLKAPAGTPEPKPLAGGQGGDRGASAAADVAGKFVVSMDKLADPAWRRANDAAFTAAANEGRVAYVD